MTRIDCSSDFLHMNWANDAGVLMRCNTKKISNTHHLIHKHEYYFRSPSFFLFYRIAGLARLHSRVESWKCRGVSYNGRSEGKVLGVYTREAL